MSIVCCLLLATCRPAPGHSEGFSARTDQEKCARPSQDLLIILLCSGVKVGKRKAKRERHKKNKAARNAAAGEGLPVILQALLFQHFLSYIARRRAEAEEQKEVEEQVEVEVEPTPAEGSTEESESSRVWA